MVVEEEVDLLCVKVERSKEVLHISAPRLRAESTWQ